MSIANIPDPVRDIIERHHAQDSERSARSRARFERIEGHRARLSALSAEKQRLAPFIDRLFKERADGNGGTVREPDPKLEKLDAEIEQERKRLARLQALQESSAMPAAKLEANLPSVPFVEVPREFKLGKGESKTEALKRLRATTAELHAEKKAVNKAPLTLAEVRTRVRSSLEAIEAQGRPNTLAAFYGGEIELPSVKLPDRSPFINYVPNGVAFAVWMVGVDAVMKRLDPLLEFNADPSNALSEENKEKRLREIDGELERLGREEAALVEAIVAEGGTAFHRPDANVLHVLGIAVAD